MRNASVALGRPALRPVEVVLRHVRNTTRWVADAVRAIAEDRAGGLSAESRYPTGSTRDQTERAVVTDGAPVVSNEVAEGTPGEV